MTPEILRTPLHELALSTKLLQLGDVEQFLGKAIERPSQQSITEALVTLQGGDVIHVMVVTCARDMQPKD